MRIVSASGDRAADDSPALGIACYKQINGDLYRHVGVVRDHALAERWVNGEDVHLVGVYAPVEDAS